MLGLFYNICFILYPTEQLLVQIKKPKLAIVTHWMIWWYLFSIFLLLEELGLDWIPFWYVIKTSVLFSNYHPNVSSFSLDMIKVSAKKIKKHPRFTLILPYWNNGKVFLTETFQDLYQICMGKMLGLQRDSDKSDENNGKIKLKNQ